METKIKKYSKIIKEDDELKNELNKGFNIKQTALRLDYKLYNELNKICIENDIKNKSGAIRFLMRLGISYSKINKEFYESELNKLKDVDSQNGFSAKKFMEIVEKPGLITTL